MRRLIGTLILLVCLTLPLQGCRDRIDLEDATLSLSVGIDLSKDNKLLFYSSSPVFSKEAKKKTEEYGVTSETLRFARDEFDAVVTALTSKGKVQVILISKKIMQHEDWFPLLDVMFRDAKSTMNAKVALVDGPVVTFINYYPKDKPRLPLYITKLITTANRRNITVETTLAQLHTQLFEKGITPAVTELKMEKSLEVAGTALLDEKGKYADTLLLQDSELLRMLQDQKKGQLSLTIPVKGIEDNIFHFNRTSFYVENLHRKVKVDYKDGKFRFHITLKLSALMTERLFPYDMKKHLDQFRLLIKGEIEKRCKQLVTRMQKKQLDPIGLGMYARAYEYKAWKQVENRWGEAISDAQIDVTIDLKMLNMGLIR
ncbi:Ger(x)C family spore germination protein [Paenibacillus rigui]|uniref:Spore gernimation protein n=1 Tax=Paenibacillus rigui TaxID=554312 RepID=A0A229UIR0_9BACL|nr:Ger(x)C family spore germination protein [Paenibacillus rigui]OXM83254.1 spore gernimation protein [Paenibacillus rigui]